MFRIYNANNTILTHYFYILIYYLFFMYRPPRYYSNVGEHIQEPISFSDWVQGNALVIPDNNTKIPRDYFDTVNRVNPTIEEIKLGEECTTINYSIHICGFSELKKISFGKNSFTLSKNSYRKKKGSEMIIRDCNRLKEINFGCYSFSSCPCFKLESRHSLLIMILDLKSLETLVFGGDFDTSSFQSADFELSGMLSSIISIRF